MNISIEHFCRLACADLKPVHLCWLYLLYAACVIEWDEMAGGVDRRFGLAVGASPLLCAAVNTGVLGFAPITWQTGLLS